MSVTSIEQKTISAADKETWRLILICFQQQYLFLLLSVHSCD